jgi:hypothetical protein
MQLPSSSVPQADVLSDVIRVAEAVQHGARTFQRIGEYIQKGDRQGRYYRLAAEILGLVVNRANDARLTTFGRQVLACESPQRNELVRQAVLNAELFQRVLPFLELYPGGVSLNSLKTFLAEVTKMRDAMVERRIHTVVSWLIEIGVLRQVNDRFSLAPSVFNTLPIIEFNNIAEPLFPQTGELNEYTNVEERTSKAKGEIIVRINEVARERANQAHARLVNLVADRIRRAGSIPRCNKLIDLSGRVSDEPDIYEMKSISGTNVRSQIRRGLSQLYEYRYLQNLSDARLVLVLEESLPNELHWMQQYLEEDRQVRLIWDGNDELYASTTTRQELAYLWQTN